MRFGPMELGLILLIVLLLFGARNLPQIFEAFGKGIKSFKDAQRADDSVDVTPSRKEIGKDRVQDAHEIKEKV